MSHQVIFYLISVSLNMLSNVCVVEFQTKLRVFGVTGVSVRTLAVELFLIGDGIGHTRARKSMTNV